MAAVVWLDEVLPCIVPRWTMYILTVRTYVRAVQYTIHVVLEARRVDQDHVVWKLEKKRKSTADEANAYPTRKA